MANKGVQPDDIVNQLKSGAKQPGELKKRLNIARGNNTGFKDMLRQLVTEGRIIQRADNRFGLPDKNSSPIPAAAEKSTVPRPLPAEIIKERENVLAALAREPLAVPDVAKKLNIYNGQLVSLQKTVKHLEREGLIQFYAGNKIGLPDYKPHNDHKAERRDSPRQIPEQDNAKPEPRRNAPVNLVGQLVERGGHKFIQPLSRKARDLQPVRDDAVGDAKPGDIVTFTEEPKGKGPAWANIVKKLGGENDVGMFSKIAMEEQGIRTVFSEAAKAQARDIVKMGVPQPGGHIRDLRDKIIFPIDPEDARDADDAISAEVNEKTIRLFVSIANVAHYIPEGSPIDEEAWERGNSTYMPDRVNHMLLPELSAGLCSLRAGEDRLTITTELIFDHDGNLLSHEEYPAIVNLKANLSYQEANDAHEGRYNEKTAPLRAAINDINVAADALEKAYLRRGALDLDQTEHKVRMKVTAATAPGPIPEGALTRENIVIEREKKLRSHRAVQLAMLAVNNVIGKIMNKAGVGLFRNHEPPAFDINDEEDKLAQAVDEFLAYGVKTDAAELMTRDGQKRVAAQASDLPAKDQILYLLTRMQTQAYYGPNNMGHYALAYDVDDGEAYAHFTSPIRRYPDLFNQRALAKLKGWSGAGGDNPPHSPQETGAHSSETERRSDRAERKAGESYAAAYLAEHLGEKVTGIVTKVKNHGVFVTLDNTGVEAFMPLACMSEDFYKVKGNALVGQQKGIVYRKGAPISVVLKETDGLLGRVILSHADDKGADFTPVSKKGPRPG